jgi:membrane associated rhomboid family serine protease
VPRRVPDLARILTFGGRVPAAVGAVISLTVFSSILGWLDRSLAAFAALAPVLVWRGEVWRLVTWPFLQDSPFTLLFGCFMLWSFGQQLSYVWSERRFLTRLAGYTLGAGVLTSLLALVWDPAATPHLGMWPVANALLFAWAMLYPDRQVNIWGVLPLTGKTLAMLVVGATVLYGIAAGGVAGIGAFAPHLFAIGIAWVQGRPRARGRPFGDQARRWWAERETKRRAKHLKVVRKDGTGGERPWMN